MLFDSMNALLRDLVLELSNVIYPDGHVPTVHPECEDLAACVICRDGVFICKRCGGADMSLTTMCPGRSLTVKEWIAVGIGDTDYRIGGWISGVASVHSARSRVL